MSAASSPSTAHSAVRGMSRLVNVADQPGPDRGAVLCSELEAGNILYFSRTPFDFPNQDIEFLLTRKQTDTALHKNIAYRPAVDRITGVEESSGPGVERLRSI